MGNYYSTARGADDACLRADHPRASSSSSSTASASASCPTRPPTATRAATRSATSRAGAAAAADAARARPDARVAHLRRHGAGAAPLRRVRPDGRSVARQGLGDRPLGADGPRARPAVSDVSRRLSAGRDRASSSAASAGARSATRRRRAPRSSTSSAPSTCATGAPIVYTSADSVFQIAAHEDVIPIAELYRICEIAYELVGDGPRRRPRDRAAVRRRARARSSAPPTATTTRCRRSRRRCSIALTARGHAGRRDRQDRGSVRRPRHHAAPCTPTSDDDGMDEIERGDGDRRRAGLIFANLVDFDTRLRPPQRRRRLRRATSSASTRGWPRCCRGSRADDLLIITADHGNDPTTPSTDHSREYVPLLVVGRGVRGRRRPRRRGRRSPTSGRRSPSCSASAPLAHGTSFLADILAMIATPAAMTASASSSKQREREILAPQAAKSADSRGRAAARGRGSDPAGVPARSRSHHPLQGVPPAEAQDAGVLRADRRSLPHPADAHARGLADRAHASPRCCGCTRS